MSDDIELVSGNAFRDFDDPAADIRHAKSVLATEIIKTFDARHWSTRKAEQETGLRPRGEAGFPLLYP